jgi:hypothetical protein
MKNGKEDNMHVHIYRIYSIKSMYSNLSHYSQQINDKVFTMKRKKQDYVQNSCSGGMPTGIPMSMPGIKAGHCIG